MTDEVHVDRRESRRATDSPRWCERCKAWGGTRTLHGVTNLEPAVAARAGGLHRTIVAVTITRAASGGSERRWSQ